jgi:hypothetical protein
MADLTNLFRRLSQYNNIVGKYFDGDNMGGLLDKTIGNRSLGTSLANVTRRLGNDASLLAPLSDATHSGDAVGLPELLRAGTGNSLAQLFETVSRHPRNGDPSKLIDSLEAIRPKFAE